MTNALAFPTLTGSLESYIQAVNRFPLLSHEEELHFARRLKYHQDLDAAKQLILSHLRVVVAVARGYSGYGLQQADLIQEGNVGLMKAVRRFDPERGVRLVSFALHWIRAEIHEFILRNWRIVKVATTKAQRKLFFNLRSLKRNLDSFGAKQLKDVAKKLGVKPEEVAEMEIRMGGHDIALEPADEEDGFSPIAYLTDGSDPSGELERKQSEKLHGEGLSRALQSLDARSRRIVEARWLKEDDDSATLHDLAREYKVSAERIRQIEEKALHKMKRLMAPGAA